MVVLCVLQDFKPLDQTFDPYLDVF